MVKRGSRKSSSDGADEVQSGDSTSDECDVKDVLLNAGEPSNSPTRVVKSERDDNSVEILQFAGDSKDFLSSADSMEAEFTPAEDESSAAAAASTTAGKRRRGRPRRVVAPPAGDGAKPPCLCDTCGKEFTNVTYLAQHVRTHTGERPYTCGECGRQFRHTANLQRHQKVHTGEKPHVCDMCGAGFIQNVMLLDHKSRHHLEMVDISCAPFLCRLCGERFLTTHRLRTHKAMAHRRLQRSVVRRPKLVKPDAESSDGRTYECEQCAEQFVSKVSLSLHMRRHVVKKPFECSVCSCAFDVESELADHMRRHMSNWPRTVNGADETGDASLLDLDFEGRQAESNSLYECTVCRKQVKQLAHLKSHMLMHTGLRPYKCQMCDKAYRSKFDLRLHCVRIHGVELPAGRKADSSAC